MKTAIYTGNILEQDELRKEYKARAAKKWTKSIAVDAAVPKGWSVARQYKKTKKIEIPKKKPVQWEDRVWLLFCDMGLQKLNTRPLQVIIRHATGSQKQKVAEIDVLAADEEFVFIIECKTKTVTGKLKRLPQFVALINEKRGELVKALKPIFPDQKFVFVLATENIIWDENSRRDAEQKKIRVLDEYDVDALSQFTKVAGRGAKFQVFNHLFRNERIKNFDVVVPALEGRMGGKRFYTFAIQPIHLLKLAYVHQRRESSLVAISETYQRVLNTSRLTKIGTYIEDGGFFPGSVIVNFNRPIKKVEQIGSKKQLEHASSRPVLLTLPPYYGSAWIIDGQHRLYAYADLGEKHTEMLPVVAFVEESIGTQARIFIDINQNQKAIGPDLRWDLYEDLYADSATEEETKLYAISRIAKALAKEKAGALEGKISMPSDTSGHITLTNLCSTIRRNQFIGRDGHFEKFTEKEVIDRFSAFFQTIKMLLPVEWERNGSHFISHNTGITILLSILSDLLYAATPKEKKVLNDYTDFVLRYFTPLCDHLRGSSPDTIKGYITGAASFAGRTKIQSELTKVIQSSHNVRSVFLEQREHSTEEAPEIPLPNVLELLQNPESKSLEVKGSLSVDMKRYLLGDGVAKRETRLALEGVLKTIVAFANTGGGILIIGAVEKSDFSGISEESQSDLLEYYEYYIVGLEVEYDKKGWDGYLLRLQQLIDSHISEDITIDGLEVDTFDVEGRTLCIIRVHPCDTWQYLDGDKFYIRSANRTLLLSGAKADSFKQRRSLP